MFHNNGYRQLNDQHLKFLSYDPIYDTLTPSYQLFSETCVDIRWCFIVYWLLLKRPEDLNSAEYSFPSGNSSQMNATYFIQLLRVQNTDRPNGRVCANFI